MKKAVLIIKMILLFLLISFFILTLAFLSIWFYEDMGKKKRAPAILAQVNIIEMRLLMFVDFSVGMEDGKTPSQAFLVSYEKITDHHRKRGSSNPTQWGDHRFFINADLRLWEKAYEHFEANEKERIPEEIALFAFSQETGEYQYVTFAGTSGHSDNISFRNIKEIK